jgi:hypothetical protein
MVNTAGFSLTMAVFYTLLAEKGRIQRTRAFLIALVNLR